MSESEVYVACLACGGLGFLAGCAACGLWAVSELWRAVWRLR